jgi:hypothetical protein
MSDDSDEEDEEENLTLEAQAALKSDPIDWVKNEAKDKDENE